MGRQEVQEARKHLRHGSLSEMVQQRSKESPFCNRMTRLHAEITLDKATFMIRDEGPGFNTSIVPDRHDPSHLGQGEGRGLVLMKNFMDDVRFNDAGNEVTMVLHCQAERCSDVSSV